MPEKKNISSRPSGRKPDELREIHLTRQAAKYAEGSCLVKYGHTHVLCAASVTEHVPPWLRNSGRGWVTAEYGMLPRSTGTRGRRESVGGKQSGRTQEIQRLIGRSLRAITDLDSLGERQIILDCDVLQADGGTRTASITGAFVALYEALRVLKERGFIDKIPITDQIAAVSCGIYEGIPMVDLDYIEDSAALVDANFVLTSKNNIVEIQSTAEDHPFSEKDFLDLLELAKSGIAKLTKIQRDTLKI